MGKGVVKMKISISHTETETQQADLIVTFIKGLIPGAKVSRKDLQAETKHTYITTRRKGKT